MKILWTWLLELCDVDQHPTVEEGARVLTRGGLYAVVVELKDNRVLLELAQNVRVQAERTAVQAVVNKGAAAGA